LSEEEKKLFLDIDFNTEKSIEELTKEIANLQLEADLKPINLKITSIQSAIDKVQEGNMGISDYLDFEKTAFSEESGMAWGEDGIIAYEEFLAKT